MDQLNSQLNIELRSSLANVVGMAVFEKAESDWAPIAEILADEKTKEFIAALNGFILIFNYKTGIYEYISEGIRSELGHCTEQFIGNTGVDHVYALLMPEHGRFLVDTIAPRMMDYLIKNVTPETGKNYCYNSCLKIRNTDNEHFWYLLNTVIIQTCDNGFPLRTMLTCTNIHQYKKDEYVYYNLKKKDQSGIFFTVFDGIANKDMDAINLTARELEILNLIGEGFSNKQIAYKLFVSLNTINTHRKNILRKTDCKGAAELTRFAFDKGLIR